MLRRLKILSLWVAIAFLLLVVAVVINGIRFATLRPGMRGKYTNQFAALIEAAQPGTSGAANGWDDVVAADEAHRRAREIIERRDRPPNWPYELSWPLRPEEVLDPEVTDEHRAEFDIAMAAYRDSGLFDALAKIAGRTRFVRPGSTEPKLAEIIPELVSVSNWGRVCQARMLLAAKTGDAPAFLRAAEDLAGLTRMCGALPEIGNKLRGAGCGALLAQCVRRAASVDAFTADDLNAMRRAVETARMVRPGELVLEHDRLMFLDFIESSYSDDGEGDGVFLPFAVLREGDRRKFPEGSTQAKFAQALSVYMTYFDAGKRDSLDKRKEFDDAFAAYLVKGLRERAAGENPSAGIDSLPRKYKNLKLLLWSSDRTVDIFDRSDLERDAAKLAVAIEIHRRTSGAYPASLADLGPELAACALDPRWASDLRFRMFRDGEERAGRPFLIYWIGVDGRDDDGAMHQQGSHKAFKDLDGPADFQFDPPEGDM